MNKWVISYVSYDEEFFWREELLNNLDEFIGLGNVKTFNTKEEAEVFRLKNSDYFDNYYVKELTDEEIGVLNGA